MDISSMMTSGGDYLKKEDITKPVTATIKTTELKEFKGDDGTEQKIAVTFNEIEKPLLLNKTNLKRLAKICGSTDTDEWVGKKCMVYVDDMVEMGGKIVGGLRVRPAQSFDDDIPF